MAEHSIPPAASSRELGIPLPESRVWTETERAHALAVYAETNSTTAASKQTGIPPTTIQSWARSEKGAEAIETIRKQLREHVAWKYVQAVNESIDIVLKRLRYGDEVVLGNGMIVNRGVSARDAIMIASISQDKHASLVGQLDSMGKTDAALSSLASKLMDKLIKLNPSDNQKVKPISPDSNPSDDFLG